MTTSRKVLRSLVFLVVCAAAWELLARARFMSGRWPHLLTVGAAFLSDWRAIVLATSRTAWQVACAAAIAAAFGVPLGLFVSGGHRIAGIYGAMAGLKAVPVTVLIPIFMTIFGLERFFIPLVALPIALNLCVNTAQAIAQASRTRLRLLQSWSVPYAVYIRNVLPFECLDSMLQTVRIMLPFAFALHVAMDYFLNTPQGLGSYVYNSYTTYRYGRMFAGTLVAAGVGLALGKGLDRASWRLLRWKRDM